MNILVIDTSCKTAMAAISNDGKIIASICLQDNKTHSVKMLPAIEYIMQASDMRPENIDLIGVTNGPGSYTGLRIGVTTAKIFAYTQNIPIFGINTLESLAVSCSFSPNDIICPMIDAKNKRVYAAVYKNAEVLRETEALECREMCEFLKNSFPGQNIIFTGDGSIENSDLISDIMGENYIQAPVEFSCGNPAAIAHITRKKYCEAVRNNSLCDFSAESIKVNYYKNYTDSI